MISELISEQDHAVFREHGITVLTARTYDGRLSVNVTGPDGEHVRDIVRARLGAEVDVGVCGDTPREIRPIACCGHMERDAGRLQLRYVMGGDRHLDHIEVREDDDAVFIYGTVCVPVEDDYGDEMECPYHVYLDRSRGGRPVIDEVNNRRVPYKNVYDELKRKYGLS